MNAVAKSFPTPEINFRTLSRLDSGVLSPRLLQGAGAEGGVAGAGIKETSDRLSIGNEGINQSFAGMAAGFHPGVLEALPVAPDLPSIKATP